MIVVASTCPIQAAIEKTRSEPERRHPALEVCNYQTELIPLAIIALRVGEQLTHQIVPYQDNYVGDSGELHSHDALLKTTSEETLWLLFCAPSQTYVAYQPHPHRRLPLELNSPIARIESEGFPFGKLVARKTADEQLEIEINAGFRPFWSSVHWRAEVWKKLGTHPGNILIYTDAEQVTAAINGDEMPVNSEIRNQRKVWVIDPYARIPRIRDKVGKRMG